MSCLDWLCKTWYLWFDCVKLAIVSLLDDFLSSLKLVCICFYVSLNLNMSEKERSLVIWLEIWHCFSLIMVIMCDYNSFFLHHHHHLQCISFHYRNALMSGENVDPSTMTIEFLRARLQSQRAEFRAERLRARVLAQKVWLFNLCYW